MTEIERLEIQRLTAEIRRASEINTLTLLVQSKMRLTNIFCSEATCGKVATLSIEGGEDSIYSMWIQCDNHGRDRKGAREFEFAKFCRRLNTLISGE
jgi:hypothetical protein